ncbi:hypothetical protein N5C81_03735 [Rhizobium pusense]|uniref:hypothetical protein n=1 Tax=Agrobacterium pusense TaxID=648995 RepID=UPI00244D4A9F|nr:hypothetical protein [Agrobacterium pusense]MDH1266726.1 hypothetical protein [Agrobacterium pusense]
MKLGELRGAIRKTKGSPFTIVTIGGEAITLVLQKTPLLEELDRLFPGGKAAETGLTFDTTTGELDGFDSAGAAVEAFDVDNLSILDVDIGVLEVSSSTVDPDDLLV